MAEPVSHLICSLHCKLLGLIFLPRQLISCVQCAHLNPQNIFHCGLSEGGSEDASIPLMGHLADQVVDSQIFVCPITETWGVW